jgi:hypothetical protein
MKVRAGADPEPGGPGRAAGGAGEGGRARYGAPRGGRGAR